MAHRVPIDWNDLEIALTMHMDEQSSYLNLRTGKVELTANETIGSDVGLSEEEVETGFAEGYLIPIEPLSSQTEYRWMADFAETVADRRLREMLDLALDGRGAFRRFKAVLSDYRSNASAGLHFAKNVWIRGRRSGLAKTTSSPQPRDRKESGELAAQATAKSVDDR